MTWTDERTLKEGLSGEVRPYEVLVALVHDLRDGDDDEACYTCGHTFELHEIGGDEDPPGFEPFCNECSPPDCAHRFAAFPPLWGRERLACCGGWSHEGHEATCARYRGDE